MPRPVRGALLFLALLAALTAAAWLIGYITPGGNGG